MRFFRSTRLPVIALAWARGWVAGGHLTPYSARMRQASFPVTKRFEFDLTASSITRATFGYLASLEWIRAATNTCLIGPAGTGKSHVLAALGVAAVEAGHKVRYFTAAELVETLYRALADNSVGRSSLTCDTFAGLERGRVAGRRPRKPATSVFT